MLELDQIRTNGGTQSRVELNQETVAEYAQAFTAGASFPPVVVFFDGANYWLADGFHRYFGARDAGESAIDAEIRTGTQRDAVLYSWGANDKHGLPRSNADKRHIVTVILKDEQGRQWSDRDIAKRFGFANSFVSKMRQSLFSENSENPAERTYTTKHGTTAVMNTANIGVQQHREAAKARHEADIARGRHGSEPAPLHAVAPTGDVTNDADTGQSIDELIAEIQKENEQLHAQLKAMEADDTKAELRKALLQRDHAIRQQSEAMDKAHKSQDREKWAKRQLMRCGKAVGEEDPDKIAAAVEAFIRQYRKAA